MEKTLFQKIIDREIPADIVYEDDVCVGFLDIHPQSKGHLLLVTRIPFGRIEFVPEDQLTHLMKTAQTIIISMKKSLGCNYVQVEMVGKGVPEHFHIHLVPRMEADHVPESPYQYYSSEAEQRSFRDAIKNSL